MAASSYQLHNPNSFLLDSVFQLPNNLTHEPYCFSQFYQTESYNDQSTKVVKNTNNEPFVTNKTSSFLETEYSSSVTDKVESGELDYNPLMDKKRKSSEGSSSMSSVQSKNARLKRRNCHVSRDAKEKKARDDMKEDQEDAPTEYIHVRARRGQATDSHSLAERVRREKISERMKVLQTLVPGCDKVTGKALMLDEIINYVQSLQNQVEFLSMKLATLNPMYYDFGMDLDALMVKPEQQWSPADTAQPASVIPNTISSSYSRLDTSASHMFQQPHFQNPISQGNGQLLWGEDDQRQKLINQSGFSNNLCSFQ